MIKLRIGDRLEAHYCTMRWSEGIWATCIKDSTGPISVTFVTNCDTLPKGIEDKVKLTGSLSPPSGKYKREDCVGVKKRAKKKENMKSALVEEVDFSFSKQNFLRQSKIIWLIYYIIILVDNIMFSLGDNFAICKLWTFILFSSGPYDIILFTSIFRWYMTMNIFRFTAENCSNVNRKIFHRFFILWRAIWH